MCFARDTRHSMDDTVVSFERRDAEALEVESENDVISLSRGMELRELLDELSRHFWCFRQKGYLYGNKLTCPDCAEDLLIMDGDTVARACRVRERQFARIRAASLHETVFGLYFRLRILLATSGCHSSRGRMRGVFTQRADAPSSTSLSASHDASENSNDDFLIDQTIRFHPLSEISPIFATSLSASDE